MPAFPRRALRLRRPASWSQDRGAGAVEYVGVILLVVVLVAALATAVRSSDVAQTVAERVTCAVRSIGTQAGDCGGDDVPTYYGGDEDGPAGGETSAAGGSEGPRRSSAPPEELGGSRPAGGSDADGADGDEVENRTPEYANASGTRPAADEERVEEALDDVRDALDGGFWGVRGGDLEDAKEALEGLNGREIDAVVAAMSDDELAHWVDQLEDGWLFGGWSREERRELWELLASRASKETLDRLAEHTDELQPDFRRVGGDDARDDPQTPAGGGRYGEVPHDLVVAGVTPQDVAQGRLGDCWFQVALMAVAQADPSVIEQAITSNPNGTYTVRLYEDGEPVDVTVTPEMVLMPDGSPAFSTAGLRILDGEKAVGHELWPLVMEKALAVHWGNDYAELEGNHPSVAFELLTGTPAQMARADSGTFSGQDLARVLEGGGLVAVGTHGDRDGLPDIYDRAAEEGGLVNQHAYVLTSADTEAGTLTFVNPWSWDLPHVTVTYAEYEQYFSGVYVSEATR